MSTAAVSVVTTNASIMDFGDPSASNTSNGRGACDLGIPGASGSRSRLRGLTSCLVLSIVVFSLLYPVFMIFVPSYILMLFGLYEERVPPDASALISLVGLTMFFWSAPRIRDLANALLRAVMNRPIIWLGGFLPPVLLAQELYMGGPVFPIWALIFPYHFMGAVHGLVGLAFIFATPFPLASKWLSLLLWSLGWYTLGVLYVSLIYLAASIALNMRNLLLSAAGLRSRKPPRLPDRGC